MTIQEKMEREVNSSIDVETRTLFPSLYDGFRETDALAQGENAILHVLKNIIYRYFKDRNMQTMTENAVAVFEERLGLSQTGTVQERRQRVIDSINTRFINNDLTIEERAREAAGNRAILVNTDCRTLIADITTQNSEDATFDELIAAHRGIQAEMPQNILIRAIAKIRMHKTLVAYAAARTAVHLRLGHARAIVEKTAYFTNAGSAYGSETTLSTGYKRMYSESGEGIPFRPEIEYTLVRYVKKTGEDVEPGTESSGISNWYFGLASNQTFQLYLYLKPERTVSYGAVVYREAPATLHTAYLSADKSPKTVTTGKVEYLYDVDGNKIPYPEANNIVNVAYYYANGERIYNDDVKIRMTKYSRMLAVGVASAITIDRIEYSIQPGIY